MQKQVTSKLKNQGLLVAGIATLFLFIAVTVLVISGVTQSIDSKLAIVINTGLGPAFTTLMQLASNYGREYFWISIVAIMLIFGKKDMKILAIELAVLFAVGIAVGESLKLLIFRERPYEKLVGQIVLRGSPDTDSSFPSGHALIVSIGALFVILKFRKKIVAWLLAFEAAVVCYSRVYLGLHYPTDILAGLLVGSTIVLIGLFVLENYFPKLLDSFGRWFERLFKSLRIPAVL